MYSMETQIKFQRSLNCLISMVWLLLPSIVPMLHPLRAPAGRTNATSPFRSHSQCSPGPVFSGSPLICNTDIIGLSLPSMLGEPWTLRAQEDSFCILYFLDFYRSMIDIFYFLYFFSIFIF